ESSMEILIYGIAASFLLFYGLISKKIEATHLTGPIIFVTFGYLLSSDVSGVISNKDHSILNIIANFTLILILFSDASRINLSLFKNEHDLPRRLLGIGLPITIIFGTITGVIIFYDLPFWQVAIIATILAPTDAALAQAVINCKRVPGRIRQALNVESGLNDGICFPILLMFTSLAGAASENESINWVELIGFQLLLGPLVGFVIGNFGGKLLVWAVNKGWMSADFQRLAIISLSFMAFCFATLVGGNGFISAFTAGLFFGNTARTVSEPIYEFGEAESGLLILLTFMLFGAMLVPKAIHIDRIQWDIVVYALLSLTLVRMIPVAISLIGKGLSRATILYIGWFGPRGAASILYLLLVVDKFHLSGEHVIFEVTTVTVLFSVFLHGLTAKWGANTYADALAASPAKEPIAESRKTDELPTRVAS
ncbi:MAG: cation:proton antiporter, partial [Chlamydiota bacterium]